jgi:hypothetical protein
MSGAEHYLRLSTLGLPTQFNGAPSPPPELRIFWTKSTEPMASPSADWTGSNRVCVTIGSRDVLRTPALVSAISFGSHAAALTRYTSPPWAMPRIHGRCLVSQDEAYLESRRAHTQDVGCVLWRIFWNQRKTVFCLDCVLKTIYVLLNKHFVETRLVSA